MSLTAGIDGSIQNHQQDTKMEDKSEFSVFVPTMFQDKALDWLLKKIDEDIATVATYSNPESAQDSIYQAAINRAKLVSHSLLVMYSPREFKVNAEAIKNEIDKHWLTR